MRRIIPLVVVLAVSLAWIPQVHAAQRRPGAKLPVPSRGSASAAILPDGAPVWVVHQDDGRVDVLSALSTHRPFGVSVLVGWCQAREGFEDPMYQSSWTQDGSRAGGPAPSDLAHFEVRSRNADRISVRTRETPAPRRTVAPSDAIPRAGVPCWDPHALDYNPGSTITHDAAGVAQAKPRRLPALAARGTAPGFRLVSGASLVVNRDAAAEICELRSGGDCTTIDIAGLTRDPRLGVDPVPRVVLEGDFLVRVGSGRLSDVAFVHGYKITEPAPLVVPDGGCYNDPPPGAQICA